MRRRELPSVAAPRRQVASDPLPDRPKVARRLGIDGRDVYRLIFDGELDGRPDADGIVYVSEASVEAYLETHGTENVSNNLSNELRRTGPDDAGRAEPETPSDLHEHGRSRTTPDVPERKTPGS